LFAAQFALSHACWLLTYPLAGWLGANTAWSVAFAVFAILATAAVVAACFVWPSSDPDTILMFTRGSSQDEMHVVLGVKSVDPNDSRGVDDARSPK
jgi:predicted MFS family arabinose efflux permease